MAVQVLPVQLRATANDANGNPVPGALVYTYQTGTTTPLATYPTAADAIAATNPNANPIHADAAGRFGPIYTDGAVAVKVVIQTAAAVTVDTLDPAPFVYDSNAAATSISLTPGPALAASDVQTAFDNLEGFLAGELQEFPVVGGTANARTLTTKLNLTSLRPGLRISAVIPATNTGAMTLNVDGTGAIAVKTPRGVDTPNTYIRTDAPTDFRYDGTFWVADRVPAVATSGNFRWERFANGTMVVTNSGIAGSGSGEQTVTWPAAFANANYSVTANVQAAGTAIRSVNFTNYATGSVQFSVLNETNTRQTSTIRLIAIGEWY